MSFQWDLIGYWEIVYLLYLSLVVCVSWTQWQNAIKNMFLL